MASFGSILKTAAGFLAPAAQIASAVASTRQSFQAPPTSPTLGQEQALRQQQAGVGQDLRGIAQQLLDPNSKLLEQLTAQDEEIINRQFTQGIAQLVKTNQRQQAMGRSPIFDAERGDEQIFRAIQQGRLAARDTARQRARERVGQAAGILGQAASPISGAAGGLQSIGKAFQSQAEAQRLQQANAFRNLAFGLQDFGAGTQAKQAAPTRVATGPSVLNNVFNQPQQPQQQLFDIPRLQAFGGSF